MVKSKVQAFSRREPGPNAGVRRLSPPRGALDADLMAASAGLTLFWFGESERAEGAGRLGVLYPPDLHKDPSRALQRLNQEASGG